MQSGREMMQRAQIYRPINKSMHQKITVVKLEDCSLGFRWGGGGVVLTRRACTASSAHYYVVIGE